VDRRRFLSAPSRRDEMKREWGMGNGRHVSGNQCCETIYHQALINEETMDHNTYPVDGYNAPHILGADQEKEK
jgi:hypothetical protein